MSLMTLLRTGFVAMMEGAARSTGLSYLSLEPYDRFWAGVRDLYSPFESGMKSGSGSMTRQPYYVICCCNVWCAVE